MKYLFIIFVSMILFSCASKGSKESNELSPQSTQEEQNTSFKVNPDLVDELFIHKKHDQEKHPFRLIESHIIDLNGDGKEDQIELLAISNWSDPGDFHKIRIKLFDQEPIEFSNYSGWVTFNQNYSVPQEISSLNQLKSENILLFDWTPGSRLIMIFGWVYANEPGLRTIIDPGTQKILFNKDWQLKSLSVKKPDSFEFQGSSNFDGPVEILDLENAKLSIKENK